MMVVMNPYNNHIHVTADRVQPSLQIPIPRHYGNMYQSIIIVNQPAGLFPHEWLAPFQYDERKRK